MSEYISLASITIICFLSLFLVWHCKYEDGIVGRLALLFIAGGSAIALLQVVNGEGYIYNPTSVTMQAGVALFMLRHTYRFLRWTRTGQGEWRGKHRRTLRR